MENFESLVNASKVDPSLMRIISKRGRISSQELMRCAIKEFVHKNEEEGQRGVKKRKLTYGENNELEPDERRNML